MRRLDLTVYDPGDEIATASAEGMVRLWRVHEDGSVVQAGSPLLSVKESIAALKLTVRTFNVLTREGVCTIGDLRDRWRAGGVEWLTGLRNLGDDGVREVQDWLRELGENVS